MLLPLSPPSLNRLADGASERALVAKDAGGWGSAATHAFCSGVSSDELGSASDALKAVGTLCGWSGTGAGGQSATGAKGA